MATPAQHPSLSKAHPVPQEESGALCFSHTMHFLEGNQLFPPLTHSLIALPFSTALIQTLPSNWLSCFLRGVFLGKKITKEGRKVNLPQMFQKLLGDWEWSKEQYLSKDPTAFICEFQGFFCHYSPPFFSCTLHHVHLLYVTIEWILPKKNVSHDLAFTFS